MHTYNQIAARFGPGESTCTEHYRSRRGIQTLCIHTLFNGNTNQIAETNARDFACNAQDIASLLAPKRLAKSR
jgi:hypothetical protein